MRQGFNVAFLAFQRHAAAALNVEMNQLLAGPGLPEIADTMPDCLGAAWAFEAVRENRPAEVLRGWAMPDGTVITLAQNLGLLFIEARRDAVDPVALGKRLAWAMGLG